MLEFRDISLSDKSRAERALRQSDFRGCEYSFANNLAWRRLADTKLTFFDGFYLLCAFNGAAHPYFTFPAGCGDIHALLREMRIFAEHNGFPLTIGGVTDVQLRFFEESFPGMFTAEYDRDGSDYIYNSSDLIDLPGKKYHGKRNHLARFNELGCEFSLISEKDFDDCIVFLTNTYNNNADHIDDSFVAEQFALNTYFSYFGELGLQGGILRCDGQIIAVTIGEPVSSDTYCVHIEKADTSFNGVYAGINNCFARHCMSNYRFVNREEDLGLDGLRKAKSSYHPAFLLDKYIVTFL